jgi:hypothetical protein
MVVKGRETLSRVAKVVDLPPKKVGRHSQRPLMLADATTVVPWDTGNEIAANFRLTKPMLWFDKLKLMDHLNMQHQVQAVLEQRNNHPVFLLPRSFWTQVQIPAHCR